MSEDLQKELNDAKNNIKGLAAQAEAAKQMLNESLASCLQLRTNMQIFGSTNQELVRELSDLKRVKTELENQIVGLAEKINELNAKINELSAPKIEDNGATTDVLVSE
jgi:phage shock protein A